MNKRTTLVVACAGVLALAAAAAAEQIWVKAESVDVREGKGAIYKSVVEAPKGTALDVLAREGKWIKVKALGKEGWVFETAVSPTKVGGSGNLASALGMGPDASQVREGAVGDQLNPNVEKLAASRGMDTKGFDDLIAMRAKISPQEWEKFTAEGKVGPNAP